MSADLRERKRAELRSTIERQAVELVLEHGYDNVTVDMICTASMASQRTFFNYFGSKDMAILGPHPMVLDDAAIEDFLHRPQGDVLSDLTRMMACMLARHGDVDFELWRLRREAIHATPELMRSQAERIATKHSDIAAVVLRRLQAHARPAAAGREAENGPGDDAMNDLRAQARLIVDLWSGVARHAMRLWAERPDTNPQQVVEDLLVLLARIREA